MFKTLKNAWKISELRFKLLFTLGMLIIFRLGANIPIPGVDPQKLATLMTGGGDGIVGILNMMSGNSFNRFTIFALGVSPYITASIIFNLLQIAIPSLEKLSKEGPEGRKKIAQYTRYGTVVLAILQGYGFSYGYFRGVFVNPSFVNLSLAVLILTAGTAFLMYLGEKITEKGIGNGISLFIFAGIISSLPDGIIDTTRKLISGEVNFVSVSIFLVVALFVIAGVIMIQEGARKIPVSYAKRVVGRKMYGGQNTHIPLKVNQAGVIPAIFSTSILSIPLIIGNFVPNSAFSNFTKVWLKPESWLFNLIQFLLIIFFAYFYTSITFNPFEIAENMKKNSGFIPGIRPGKPTVDYLSKSVGRLILIGAIALGIIAILPNIVANFTQLKIPLGGTALLIVVGVALETSKQIEAQMVMRNYRGIL